MTINLIYPCDMSKCVIKSSYADHLARPNYTGKPGTDIASYGGENVSIVAASDGVVRKTGYDEDGYGNYVKLDHGNGYETLYAHLDKITKASGAVQAGDVIGIMGTTGNSTGVHVHFELRINGKCVDAMQYISPSANIPIWDNPPVANDPITLPEDGDTVTVLEGGLRLRDYPDVAAGNIIAMMDKNVKLQVNDLVLDAEGNMWAEVVLYAAIEYDGKRYLGKI